MDKDHERERKHQQNERQQQIVVSTDHQPSVDEHFEKSLRRTAQWPPTMPINIHPSLGHTQGLLQSISHSGASLSVMPSTQPSISVTRTDIGKLTSGNLSQLAQQQLLDVQRKQSLGIPVHYQQQQQAAAVVAAQQQAAHQQAAQQHAVQQQQAAQQQAAQQQAQQQQQERNRKEYERDQVRQNEAYYWAKMEEGRQAAAAAAVAKQHQQAMQQVASSYPQKFSPAIIPPQIQQPPPSSKSPQVVDSRYKIKETNITAIPGGYPFPSYYAKDTKVSLFIQLYFFSFPLNIFP